MLFITKLCISICALFAAAVVSSPDCPSTIRDYPSSGTWLRLFPDANCQEGSQGSDMARFSGYPGACANVPGWINDKTSSLIVKGGCCVLYTDANCRGSSVEYCSPSTSGANGATGVGWIGSAFNDKISSFQCANY